LIPHIKYACNGFVNPLCLSAEIRIKSAKDNPGVVGSLVTMEIQKVATIVRQQNPTFGNCQRQNLRVRHGSIRHPRVERGQHVMAKAPQFRNHLQCKVLVGIKTGH
jgi:hypothetical protein